MDKATIVFSRKGLLKDPPIAARHVRSREHARKLWPLVDPLDHAQLVTWVSPSFEGARLKKRSHFRRLSNVAGVDVKRHFELEEAERQRHAGESPEHAQAKRLLIAELKRRLATGEGLPWGFKDENASDFPLVGDLLLGASNVVDEHWLPTPFGSKFRLDIAVLGAPVVREPMVVGGIEIERWHQFDGRKALIGRSLGFPLITVDIAALQLNDLTEDWARRALTDTTKDDDQGRRWSYVYLHDVLYPQYVVIPKEVERDLKHQFLVFANDDTIDRLCRWMNQLARALGYPNGQVALQKLNGKSPSARLALDAAGSIVGAGWETFNNQRFLRISVPRPGGLGDERAHKLHATLARVLLMEDCLVGYQYAGGIGNDDPDEDLWLKFRWRKEHEQFEIHRILPKRLAEPIGRIISFFNSVAADDKPGGAGSALMRTINAKGIP